MRTIVLVLNNINNIEGGTHLTGFKNALTRVFNNYGKKNNIFKDFTPTGDFEGDLRVFDYTPKNADFFGGEAQVDFHLLPLAETRIADQSTNDPKSVGAPRSAF